MLTGWRVAVVPTAISLIGCSISVANGGAAPPIDRAFLNRFVDAEGAPTPIWAWGPGIAELADGRLMVGFKGSEKVGGAANVETFDASAIYF